LAVGLLSRHTCDGTRRADEEEAGELEEAAMQHWLRTHGLEGAVTLDGLMWW
jgi:hypothetical protein